MITNSSINQLEVYVPGVVWTGHWLFQGGGCTLESRDDSGNYLAVIGAMDVLNFDRDEKNTIVKILAAILHLGNIYFKKHHVSKIDGLASVSLS